MAGPSFSNEDTWDAQMRQAREAAVGDADTSLQPGSPAPAAPAAPVEQRDLGFAAFLASMLAGSKKTVSKRGTRLTGGKLQGEPSEVRQKAMELYAAMSDDEKAEWASKGNGDNLKPQAAPSSVLPENMRGLPNAPDVSGPRGSKTAVQRYVQMNDASAARVQSGRDSVAAKRQEQIADLPGTVAKAQAARDAELAKSGIVDMGGGVKAMSNKYGVGFSEPIDPSKKRAPGRIIDEKGEVDVAGMMAGKGQGGSVPYKPGTQATPALNADAADANRAGIAAKIAAAAPGMAERRAADQAAEVNRLKGIMGAAPAAGQPPAASVALPKAITPPNSAQVKQAAAAVAPMATAALAGSIPVVGPLATAAANALSPKFRQ